MGAPGYAIFCSNGHLCKSVGHHEINYDEVSECRHCQSKEFYEQYEFGDDDYKQYVPFRPISEVNGISVFDISKLKKKFRARGTIS